MHPKNKLVNIFSPQLDKLVIKNLKQSLNEIFI